jgi:hypothetical protein
VTQQLSFSDDILRGARAIAGFYYGDPMHARKVFHLAASGRFPVFREGNVICARKSTLLGWVAAQETAALTA